MCYGDTCLFIRAYGTIYEREKTLNMADAGFLALSQNEVVDK